MLVKLERQVPHQFYAQVAGRNYKVELIEVSYRTQYDFVIHTNLLETELSSILEAWREQIVELDICLMNNIIDSHLLHLTFYRVSAICLPESFKPML